MSTAVGLLPLTVISIIAFAVTVKGIDCQQRLTATNNSGILTSPGYPLKYPPHKICWWRIVTQDASKVVVLEIVDMLLYGADNCKSDYLLIADGNPLAHRSSKNWTLCGEDTRMIVSTGPEMNLVFESDGRYETRGFKLQYHQASAGAVCNRDFVAVRWGDTFSSPGYPGGYFNNLECNYTIRARLPDDRVEIRILDSDIEDASDCQYDRLKIINQNGGTDQVLGTVCGTETATYQSSGNTLQIQFVTNSVKVNKGFQIQFRSVYNKQCSRVHLKAGRLESYLVSPGYPYHYYSNMSCDWGIGLPRRDMDGIIEMSTITSSISGTGQNCTGDSVWIYDDDIGGTDFVFCGNQTPSFNSSQLIWLGLETDGETVDQGFVIKYRLQPETVILPNCGGVLHANSSSQILRSPLYPITPLESKECKWTFSATDVDEIVILSLTDLDIEMSNNCSFDTLAIYDVTTVRYGLFPDMRYSKNIKGALISENRHINNTENLNVQTKLTTPCRNVSDDNILETWCGQRGGEVVYSTGQHLTIVYRVDDSNNGRGFSLTYTAGQKMHSAKTFILKAKDTISYLSSPGLFHYVPPNEVISYIFEADPEKNLKLEVTHSSLPVVNGSYFGHTRVIAYDGLTDHSPRLTSIQSQTYTWCGLNMPVYIGSRHILLAYHTESLSNKNEGFQLTYIQGKFTQSRGSDCGGWWTAGPTHSFLYSPNYPHFYSNNVYCVWVLHASTNGSMIRVKGQDIDIEPKTEYPRCGYDSLIFYEGAESFSNEIGRWCGQMTSAIQSNGSYLTVVFKTDGSTTRKGFRLEFFETTEPLPCGLNLTVTSQSFHVTSPGFDQNLLPANTTCRYTLTRNAYYYQIKLITKSTATGILGDQTCSSNHVDIYDGLSENSPQIGRYCGGSDKVYMGSGDHLFVKLVTGPFSVTGGFDITYRTSSDDLCGDDFLTAYTSESIITSPNYPYQYYRNQECVWKIDSNSIDYVIVMQVITSDIDGSEGCTEDYIVVYDSYGSSSPLDRWCGSKTPTYQSTGEFMTIKFHSGNSVPGTGFKLKYWKKYEPYSSRYHSNVGAIVGGTLGGIFLFVILIVGICFCASRRAMAKRSALATTGPSYPQVVYTNQNRTFINQHTPSQNTPSYVNNTYSQPNAVQPGLTGSKSTAATHFSTDLNPETAAPPPYDAIDRGANGNAEPVTEHSSDNDGSALTCHSTHM